MTADMIRKEFLFSLGFISDDETSFQRKKKTQVRYTLTEFKRQIDVYVILLYIQCLHYSICSDYTNNPFQSV